MLGGGSFSIFTLWHGRSIAKNRYEAKTLTGDKKDDRKTSDMKKTLTHGFVPLGIDNYAAAMSAPESALRKILWKETYRKFKDEAVMMIGPQEAALLQVLILATNARRIVEIGTFTGYSAVAMIETLEAVGPGGSLITFELNEVHAKIAKRYFVKADASDTEVRLQLGNAHVYLSHLPSDRYDLAFIDAEKTGYFDYWRQCKRLVRKGGLIIADNTLSCERKPADDPSGRAIREFNEFVRKDPAVNVVLATVRDGMTIAYKR